MRVRLYVSHRVSINLFSLQRTTIVNRFANIMIKHGDATKRQYEVLQRYNENSLRAVEDIDPPSDQALYVDYNRRPFFPPPEFTFEPCAIWHDNAS